MTDLPGFSGAFEDDKLTVMQHGLSRLIPIAFAIASLHAQSCFNQALPSRPTLACGRADRLAGVCQCGADGSGCHWEWTCAPNRGARTTNPPLPPIPASPQLVFLSTDVCSDIDDAQAIAVLIWLHQHHYIQILGINADMQSPTGFPGNGGWSDGASYIHALLLRSRLNGQVPVGACPWGGANGCNWGEGDNYCYSTVEALGSPRLKLNAVNDSVALLRSVINSNPAGSIRLISIGPPVNVERFMQSPSNYNGDKLPDGPTLWAKLKDYVPMGGRLKPAGGFEFNYAYEHSSTPQGTSINYILNNSAGVPIYGNDANVGATSGGRAYYSLPSNSPLQAALAKYASVVGNGGFTLPPAPYTAYGYGRAAWDPSTVLFAAIGTGDPGDGHGPYFGLSENGTITVTVGKETSSFSTSAQSSHFVINILRPKDMQAVLEQLQQDDILPVTSRGPTIQIP